MKAIQVAAAEPELANLTIPEAEEMIEEVLEELSFTTDPGLARALRYLSPPGYQAIVELCGENGRSKRRNANADSWSPEEDELRIYFERISEDSGEEDDEPVIAPRTRALKIPSAHYVNGNVNHGNSNGIGNVINGNVSNGNVNGNSLTEDALGAMPADMDEKIKELCATLAEAERGGHAFIALKWFRDSFLPRKPFIWNQNPESRQLILAEAILRGVVLTSKIPNPKTPAYPTTTIRLNRAEAGVPEEAQRFRPVSVLGESMASTLDDDRGNM